MVWFPAETRHFSLLHSVETGSGTCPTFWSMGTGDSFPWRVKGVKLTTFHHLVLRLRMELYLHSPKCLYCVNWENFMFTQNILFWHTFSTNLSNSTTVDGQFLPVAWISGKQTTWSSTFPFQAHKILNDAKSNFTFLIAYTSKAWQELCMCSTRMWILMYTEMQTGLHMKWLLGTIWAKQKLT
jgi:hypothetical protein